MTRLSADSRVSAHVPQRDAKSASGVRHPPIVRGQFDGLAPVPEKLAGCEMQRVKCPHGHREGLERAGQYGGSQFQ